jgi:hypothetical protein
MVRKNLCDKMHIFFSQNPQKEPSDIFLVRILIPFLHFMFNQTRCLSFLLIIIVLLTHLTLAKEKYSLLKFNSNIYKEIINQENNYPKQILHSNWQLELDDSPYKQNITIPFILSKDSKKAILKYSFIWPKELIDHSLRIWFLGIQGICQIKINGSIEKEHVNFPSPFYLDVSEPLLFKSSENILEIIINRPEADEGIPNYTQIFKEETLFGILREIYFEWHPPIHIRNVSYKFKNNNLLYSFKLKIKNGELKTKNLKLEETIIAPTGNKIYNRFQYITDKVDERTYNRTKELTVPIYWSPEHPRLYKLILEIKSNMNSLVKIEKNIGIRELAIKKYSFILNDEDIIMRGITYREPYHLLSSKNNSKDFYQYIYNDFLNIKKMDFNAIRFPHSVPHPYCVYLADSLGLFIFIENGLWRLPKIFYQSNKFLQTAKSISEEIVRKFYLNPSLVAIGLGDEIPLNDSATSKFILIIKEYLRQKYNVLSYVSPLDIIHLPQNNVANFYLINKYDDSIIDYISLPIIFGNIGFSTKVPDHRFDSIEAEKLQFAKMQKFFMLYIKEENLDGFFIESYRDWKAEFLSNFTAELEKETAVYPYGIFSWKNNARYLFQFIPTLLKGDLGKHIEEEPAKSKKSNFFSITAFIASIVFFLIYRNNYRLKENLSRALTHPYGFFVDVRDRRIISTFNSTVMGLFAIVLFINFINAYLYYYHDNLFIQEFICVILNRLHIKYSYLAILRKPWQTFIFLFIILYLVSLFLVVFIKFFSIFFKGRLRYRQTIALVNWSGAPIIFFIPFSILSYHLIPYRDFQTYIIMIFILFCIWYNYRLSYGIRVLFMIRPYKIIIIILLTYGLLIFTLLTMVFNTNILSYLKLLTEAASLF